MNTRSFCRACSSALSRYTYARNENMGRSTNVLDKQLETELKEATLALTDGVVQEKLSLCEGQGGRNEIQTIEER